MIGFKNGFILLVLYLFAEANVVAQSQNDFKNPPSKYRPVPFWHLNGELTTGGINKQVTDAVNSGFGGVTVLPVTAGPQYPTGLPSPGMAPKYLSEEYFSLYGDILSAAKSNGAHVILYDDVDFPSGSAGGKLQQKYPDQQERYWLKQIP